MTSKEIEVKWLIKDSLDLWLFIFKNLESSSYIIQFYNEITDDYEVRLRIERDVNDTKYYITKKQGDGLVRLEQEELITKHQFEQLSPTGKLAIVKDRYKLLVDEFLFEVDYYCNELDGLVVMEIELDNEADVVKLEKYKELPFFIKDITYDSEYKNKNLYLKINNK